MSTNDELFKEANAAWDTGNLGRAYALFRQAAESGDRCSQLDLGYFFDLGLHVRKDKREALRWYRRAYWQGDAGAATNIATVYRDLGQLGRMVWWFRRAAAMGDGDALLDLGKCYETGRGVAKNLETAKGFYRRVLASSAVTIHSEEQATERLAKLRTAQEPPETPRRTMGGGQRRA